MAKSKAEIMQWLKQSLGEKDFNSIKSQINKIENSPSTTRYHYGQYMSLLSRFSKRDTRSRMGSVLVLMGANKQGVKDALRILG